MYKRLLLVQKKGKFVSLVCEKKNKNENGSQEKHCVDVT